MDLDLHKEEDKEVKEADALRKSKHIEHVSPDDNDTFQMNALKIYLIGRMSTKPNTWNNWEKRQHTRRQKTSNNAKNSNVLEKINRFSFRHNRLSRQPNPNAKNLPSTLAKILRREDAKPIFSTVSNPTNYSIGTYTAPHASFAKMNTVQPYNAMPILHRQVTTPDMYTIMMPPEQSHALITAVNEPSKHTPSVITPKRSVKNLVKRFESEGGRRKYKTKKQR